MVVSSAKTTEPIWKKVLDSVSVQTPFWEFQDEQEKRKSAYIVASTKDLIMAKAVKTTTKLGKLVEMAKTIKSFHKSS